MYQLLSSSPLFYLLLLGASAKFNTLVCAGPVESLIETNPEFTAGYFEGDMILNGAQQRNGMAHTIFRWPNGVVYYKIAPGYFHIGHMNDIFLAMQKIAEVSCIRFEAAPAGFTKYVYITGNSNGCYADVGYNADTGVPTLNLARDGCFFLGIIVHELLHTLGFVHMQSASNRDDYVTIVWDNIKDNATHNFEKSRNPTQNFGQPYDYGSLMHYPDNAFAIDEIRMKTIISKRQLPYGVFMGQREKMSETDIRKLNIMYNCRRGF